MKKFGVGQLVSYKGIDKMPHGLSCTDSVWKLVTDYNKANEIITPHPVLDILLIMDVFPNGEGWEKQHSITSYNATEDDCIIAKVYGNGKYNGMISWFHPLELEPI